MLGYVGEQTGNDQERISMRGMETSCFSSAPVLCSLASELSPAQDKQAAGFAGLVLVFLIDVFVFTTNHKNPNKQLLRKEAVMGSRGGNSQ